MARVIASVFRNPTYREWLRAMEREGLEPDREAFRERDPRALLPWTHLAQGPWSADRLLKDRDRAARTAHPTGGLAERPGR